MRKFLWACQPPLPGVSAGLSSRPQMQPRPHVAAARSQHLGLGPLLLQFTRHFLAGGHQYILDWLMKRRWLPKPVPCSSSTISLSPREADFMCYITKKISFVPFG